MFTVRPYPENSSITTQWDGVDTRTGSPAALELADGMIIINDEPFLTPDRTRTRLLSEEKAALASICAGMHERAAQDRIRNWYDDPIGSVESLYYKLGVPSMRAGMAAVSLAFEKRVLIPHAPPNLGALPKEHRRRFVELVPMLGTSHPHASISKVLGVRTNTIYWHVDMLATDLRLNDLQKPGQTLVALAGAGELLEGYTNPPDLQSFLRPDISDQEERLFPSPPTKSLWDQPFEDDHTTLIRYTEQPMDRTTPDVHVGSIDRIRIENGIVDVCNPYADIAKTERLFTPRELAAFVFICLGLDRHEIALRTAIRGKGAQNPLLNVCRKLLPPATRRSRSAEQIVHEAFRRGIFVSRRTPDLRHIGPFWLDKLLAIAPLIGEGKTDAQVGEKLRLSGGTISLDLRELRNRTSHDTQTLVFLADASRVTLPITDAEARHDFDIVYAA